MKFMNQKGMEMAIQIFIVLFVLLAVAMIVLQMVSQQFTSNQNQLQDVQKSAQQAQLLSSAKLECEKLCKSSSTVDQVSYCIKTFKMGASLTPNSRDYVPGVSVCEDTVPCSQIYSCPGLSISQCKIILCSFWTSTYDLSKAKTLFSNYVTPGKCYDAMTAVDKNFHWFSIVDPNGSGKIEDAENCS